MPIWNLFKRKSTDEEQVEKIKPSEMPEPTDGEGYMRRGWAFHAQDMESEAEADFKQALALDGNSVDANYALGLTKKAQGQNEAALEYVRKAIELIEAGKVKDGAQSEMLRRLTLGHINELSEGDWNLETEIWHR